MRSPKFKLLTLLIMSCSVLAIMADYSKMHSCPACMSQNYLYKRWLMQHSPVGQVMAWTELGGTDCNEGRIRVLQCSGACLEVTIEKIINANEYQYHSHMHECSNELIHFSPDLPSHIDFKEYNDNAIFVAKRMGHRITYNFTRFSALDHNKSGKTDPELFAKIKKEKYDYKVYVTAGMVLLIIFLLWVGTSKRFRRFWRVCALDIEASATALFQRCTAPKTTNVKLNKPNSEQDLELGKALLKPKNSNVEIEEPLIESENTQAEQGNAGVQLGKALIKQENATVEDSQAPSAPETEDFGTADHPVKSINAETGEAELNSENTIEEHESVLTEPANVELANAQQEQDNVNVDHGKAQDEQEISDVELGKSNMELEVAQLESENTNSEHGEAQPEQNITEPVKEVEKPNGESETVQDEEGNIIMRL